MIERFYVQCKLLAERTKPCKATTNQTDEQPACCDHTPIWVLPDQSSRSSPATRPSVNRPERPLSIRPGYDRNGLGTGHRLGNLAERQLSDLPAGRKQHTPVIPRRGCRGVRLPWATIPAFGSSRHTTDIDTLQTAASTLGILKSLAVRSTNPMSGVFRASET